jgi:hypothetical protein
MDAEFKARRYAMIRRAALKIQKNSKVRASNARLTKEVYDLNCQDYKANISWQDNDRYIDSHYSDVYQSTQDGEWN